MRTGADIKPWISRIYPRIIPPSLSDNTADVDRLVNAIRRVPGYGEARVDFALAKRLPRKLRDCDYDVDAVLFEDRECRRLIDIRPHRAGEEIFGLAVDLGTSTVVVRLVDLAGLQTRTEVSFRNPQIEMGTDILSRIHFAAREGGLQKLQSVLIERFNQEIDQLARKHGLEKDSIVAMSAAGNTTMTHLFLGLDPHRICREPYIPVLNKPELILSTELDLRINPGAPVLVFPNVGSYFGGDLIAGILASGMTRRDEVSFLVDVGTNAEVVVGNSEWLMGCAGAAGPALEGGVAGMGMMAGPGVIDQVRIDKASGKFRIRTIGNSDPVGICGSGLIDLTAQLFLAGMLDIRGKLVAGECGKRLLDVDGVRQLVVVPAAESGTGEDLILSQPDIDALIRSKAAMYTILTTVGNTVGIALGDIRRFYVAGTFGTYINPESAITLGMIPDLPCDRFVALGNTSLEGASLALLAKEKREEVFRIRDRITYLELNVNQEFMNLFSAAKFIPHTDRSLFPSVRGRKP